MEFSSEGAVIRHRRSFGFYRFPLGLVRLIDADPTFLYNYVGEVPVVASLGRGVIFHIAFVVASGDEFIKIFQI